MKYLTSLLFVALFSTSAFASAGMYDLKGKVKVYRQTEKAFSLEIDYNQRYSSKAACNAVKDMIEETRTREFNYNGPATSVFGPALDTYLETATTPLFAEIASQKTSKFTHLDCYPSAPTLP